MWYLPGIIAGSYLPYYYPATGSVVITHIVIAGVMRHARQLTYDNLRIDEDEE